VSSDGILPEQGVRMFCANCGAAFEPSAAFCGSCGARLAAAPAAPTPASPAAEPAGQERELHRFGAFGVGITFGRPALFAWTKYNMIEVVLTDRRVCGIWNPSIARTFMSSKRGQFYFQVPIADVVGMELIPFLGRKVVWLKWREGAGFKEVSIEGTIGLNANIERLHQLLGPLLSARPAAV
jgi:hypothetical protein